MFKLDKEIIKVMNLVEEQNYNIYVVGGFVRDLYLKRTSRDLDMTTSMPLKHLKDILSNYEIKEYNEHYGSMKFEIRAYTVEITQFRQEALYLDSRHPEEIKFTDDLKKDVLRRDFKMNAIYMDKNGQVIDPIDGLEDINEKIISTVRDSEITFKEDALRIVRLYRFHSQLNFKMESSTLKAAKKHLKTIQKLKPIQVKQETIKILSSTGFETLINEHYDFIHVLLPNAKFPSEVFNLKSTWEYKLLYMYENEDLENLLNAWEFKSRKRKYLLAFKSIIEDYKTSSLQDLFIKHGSFMWFEMMTLFLNLDDNFVYRDKFLRILSEQKTRTLFDLKVHGNDLIDLKIQKHLRNQVLLKLLFDHIWNDLSNEKTQLIEQAARYKNDIH